jgi:hypothetical protein
LQGFQTFPGVSSRVTLAFSHGPPAGAKATNALPPAGSRT